MVDPLDELGPKLVGLIRLASALNAKDINFYKSIDGDVKRQSDAANRQLIRTLNKTVQSAITTSTDLDPKDFELEEDNDEENVKIVGNVLDSLFENVEIGLGRASKAAGKPGSIPASSSAGNLDDGYTYLDETDTSGGRQKGHMQHAKVPKPQLEFETPVDNFEKTPFRPLITAKPNSIVSFEESMKLVPATDDVPEHYSNPYTYEIKNQEYPEWIYSVPEKPWEPIPWHGSPEPIWIDDPSQLADLLVEMKKGKVIGVDLEHHDYRTYHGLTSLMQITTETKKDYLLDPLSPKLLPHLSVLNEVFTDPSIVKVFHGAFMDIIWLQRDLGLYVVSLFDTYHASHELGLPRHSLAFLLEKYSRFRTSKKWQLADWRVRPLNAEMRNYAKADTHFLIEVFTKMQTEILQKKPEGMKRVLYESRKVADRRFEYATYKPRNANQLGVVSTNGSVPLTDDFSEGEYATFKLDTRDLPWDSLMQNNNVQQAKGPMIEALYKWRDQHAREEDESSKYIMSDFMLSSLASAFSPNELDEFTETSVLNEVNRSAKFGSSYYVRKYIKELKSVIERTLKDISKMDIKAWVRGETPQAVDNVDANADDVYDSVKDVNRLQEEFGEIAKVYNELNFPASSSTSSTSPAYSLAKDRSAESSNGWSVEYGKKGVSIAGKKELQKRVQEVKNHLRKEHEQQEQQPLLLPEVVDDNELVKEEAIAGVIDEADEAVDDALENAEQEDPDEIITLRGHNNSNRPKKQFADNGERLDLSKQVLQPIVQDRRKRKKQQKKRVFDPYGAMSAQNPDIQRVRKRKRRDIGKQQVFKR